MHRRGKVWLALAGGIAAAYGFRRVAKAIDRHVRREMVMPILAEPTGRAG